MASISEYLNKITPSQQKEYERIKKIVNKLVPEAEETISYGIPTFKYKGKYVIYFAAYKSHMSIYPVFNEMLLDMEKAGKLGKFKITKETLKAKGTLQFTEDNKVPAVLVEEVIKSNLKRISD